MPSIKVTSNRCPRCSGSLVPGFDLMDDLVPKCIMCAREWPELMLGYVKPAPINLAELSGRPPTIKGVNLR